MSRAIEFYEGTRAYDANVSLTRYEYSDGSTNHWLFRDRKGLPYNPVDGNEAAEIISRWKLQRVF